MGRRIKRRSSYIKSKDKYFHNDGAIYREPSSDEENDEIHKTMMKKKEGPKKKIPEKIPEPFLDEPPPISSLMEQPEEEDDNQEWKKKNNQSTLNWNDSYTSGGPSRKDKILLVSGRYVHTPARPTSETPSFSDDGSSISSEIQKTPSTTPQGSTKTPNMKSTTTTTTSAHRSFFVTPKLDTPMHRDPFHELTGIDDRKEDKSNWVTVFGFTPTMTSYVVKQFSRYGDVVKSTAPPDGNWLNILYSSRFQAQKAMSKSGMVMKGEMIGVVPCLDYKGVELDSSLACIQSSQSSENTSTLPPSRKMYISLDMEDRVHRGGSMIRSSNKEQRKKRRREAVRHTRDSIEFSKRKPLKRPKKSTGYWAWVCDRILKI